jgi:hypothetical protein
MVEQILSLSLRRNIPVANFTVTVGFETTPQKMQQMQVNSGNTSCRDQKCLDQAQTNLPFGFVLGSSCTGACSMQTAV